MTSFSSIRVAGGRNVVEDACPYRTASRAALTIMVGGKPEVFERAKPLFDIMGKTVTLIGGIGDGQTAKVANQIVVGLTIEAVSEVLLGLQRSWRCTAAHDR